MFVVVALCAKLSVVVAWCLCVLWLMRCVVVACVLFRVFAFAVVVSCVRSYSL